MNEMAFQLFFSSRSSRRGREGGGRGVVGTRLILEKVRRDE